MGVAAGIAVLSQVAIANVRCQKPDAGGTAQFPPSCDSGYQTRTGVLLMNSGFPGSPILGYWRMGRIQVNSAVPGGPLGGETQDFDAEVVLMMQGTGMFAGYSRTVTLTVIGQSFTAPTGGGTSGQSFATELSQLQGQLPPGDPDFDLLRITAGSSFGLPSPGHTTLTRLASGNWAVDSFFDITYRIDFVGAPGGPFAGLSNSTVSQERLREGVPEPQRCVEPDLGWGTAAFPPSCDGHPSPLDAAVLIDGLPPGTAVMGRMFFRNLTVTSEMPGGGLGGHEQSWDAILVMELYGTGQLAGFSRTMFLPGGGKSQSGPRGGGLAIETFPTEMTALGFQIVGDPDFDLLRLTGGSSGGYAAPGQCTMTRLASGDWAVDSFFDITYRVDFVGAPGGALSGMSGSTSSGERFHSGEPERVECLVPSVAGTAEFPPSCPDGYGSPHDACVAVDSSHPQSPLVGRLVLQGLHVVSETPGGPLGGTLSLFEGVAVVETYGMGQFQGFSRSPTFLVQGLAATAPRIPGAPVQSFDTELLELSGQLPPGDPDFDLLRITSGSNHGLPSPGHTTLRLEGGGQWAVDSFFDITYRIDFVGAPGGPLAGTSSTAVSLERIVMGKPIEVCVTPDVGGTGLFPPPCPYPGPTNGCFIVDGLPPGTTLDGTIELQLLQMSEMPGGTLGGHAQQVGGGVVVTVHGTGFYAGYARVLTIPISTGETHTGPRAPGVPVQSFDTDMFMLFGQLPPGDPDFDLLRVVAGTNFGMPSPGHTTLTRLPSGDWAVDSFFDITYRVDFVGDPGGPFAGKSGSTVCSSTRFQIGEDTSLLAVGDVTGDRAQLGATIPNPTSAGSHVQLRLPAATEIEAGMYDVTGRQVRAIARGVHAAGDHTLAWDGRDESGVLAAPGLYFYKVRVGAKSFTRKTVLSR